MTLWGEPATTQRRARRDRVMLAVAIFATALAVAVSGAPVGAAGAERTRTAAASITDGAPRLGVPLVLGTAAVGERVTAEHGMAPLAPYAEGGGQYAPPLAAYSYQWLADGKPIAGETSGELQIGPALAGKSLSFRVTARMPGEGPVVTATSLRTPRVTKAGVAQIVRREPVPDTGHSRFAVTASGWPSGTKLTYQWLIDSLPVEGATGREFVLRPRTHTTMHFGAVVTATRAGYEPLVLDLRGTSRAGMVGSTLVNARAPQIVSTAGAGTPQGQRPGTLDGFVNDERGPVANARVVALRTGSGSAYTEPVVAKKATTDGDGHVSIRGLAPGNYCLKVLPLEGRAQESVECHSVWSYTTARVYADSVSTFALSVSKTVAIKGIVTDTRGRQVGGARVSAYVLEATVTGAQRLREVASVTADPRGAYRVRDLPAGSYALKVRGASTASHKTDWWRSRTSDFQFDAPYVEPGAAATRNAVLAAYLPLGVPTISGSARVGSTLTAAHTKTAGATYSYRWEADGKAIGGATKSRFTIAKAQAGKKVTVQVIGTGSGWARTTRESAATATVH